MTRQLQRGRFIKNYLDDTYLVARVSGRPPSDYMSSIMTYLSIVYTWW